MPTPLPSLKRWPKGPHLGGRVRRRDRWLMLGDTRQATAFLDLEAWPPKPVVHRSEFAVSFDTLPDGRVVVCSMPTKPPGDYAVRIHSADWPLDPTAGPTKVHPNPGGLTTAEVWVVASRVVVFDTLIRKERPPDTRRAYLLDRGKFVPAPGLPPVRSFGRDQFGHQVHANGKATLATGEEVLVWDGDGYEWTGKRFELRWELGARMNHYDWTAVPWGQDGFFYLSDRKVLHARRGHRPVHVLADTENVVSLSPGPERSIIVRPGDNPKHHVAMVWFPADGTSIPLLRGHIGYRPGWRPTPEVCWSAATGHTYLASWATIPDADLLALKRVRPRAKGYQVAEA